MVHTHSFAIYALLIVQEARARGEDCDNGLAPDYTRVVCDIIGDESGCSSVEYLQPDRSCINRNSSSDCLVSAGLELYVTCCNDDLVLFRNGQNLSSHTVSWTFATSFESGLYECRWRGNGTSFANRSVVVDGTVYVIPGDLIFNQDCERRIAGDFNCSVARSYKYYGVKDGYTLHDIQFNVLGARPISLSLEMIWVDHYPVELDLSLSNDTALNNTISHTATVESHNLVFVGRASTRAYVVVTGTTSNRSSSMCVSITFSGEVILLPNESLPAHLTVVEGQRADFHCDAHTTQLTVPAFTVSFLVKLPSSNIAQCSNHTFSRSQALIMNSAVKDRSCSGLVFTESYSGDSHLQDRTNHLTASWPSVNLSMSGAEVVCAQASSGITQWARTATLTVLPASSTSAIMLPVSPTVAMPLIHLASPDSVHWQPSLSCLLGELFY
ncbi:hypothetical protein GBAR_LOCUS22352 [Geodia barretti]|uniref:Ig-like domain-containing protein n=1 Tax=Geodia barretti TaxID=519541 RepID=A0AA35T3K2_GEOBA|nr:hypothetical protein GBAR_LOCUS22352 [Geodia barretti]